MEEPAEGVAPAHRAGGRRDYWTASRELQPWDVWACFALVIGLSTLAYHFVEEPARRAAATQRPPYRGGSTTAHGSGRRCGREESRWAR